MFIFERFLGFLIAVVTTLWMLIFGGFRAIPDYFRYRRLTRM